MINAHDGSDGERPIHAPGLTESRRDVLLVLKRAGAASVARIAAELELNRETVREHVRVLVADGLVARATAQAARTGARGRPEQLYGLTDASERLFPRREGELLRELAAHLTSTGNEALLRGFLEGWIGARRLESSQRVASLEGRARMEEVARILSEDGVMAEVEGSDDAPRLRLGHCPLRGLVDATALPCRMEIAYVTQLMGRPLTRLDHMPAGDRCCSYRAEPASA
jgi:predicted ArsR family transcriptional regulator